MQAVPRKRLATKPTALSVGCGEWVGCVSDIVAVDDGDVLGGDEC